MTPGDQSIGESAARQRLIYLDRLAEDAVAAVTFRKIDEERERLKSFLRQLRRGRRAATAPKEERP